MELSFGEQIKIILKRHDMTIKDLADLYTEKTGNAMSRQNLTQRLKRDNFPEQDMQTIASLLGYNVSIKLIPSDAIPIEYVEIDQTIARSEAEHHAKFSPFEHGKTAHKTTDSRSTHPLPETAHSKHSETIPWTTDSEMPGPILVTTYDNRSEAHPETADHEGRDDVTFQIPAAFRKSKPVGDINPLSGKEYLTNTVRRHPEIEEFVQVYDQTTHSWSDVREDYFWEFQEKKKQMMGADYKAPIQI